MFSELHVSGWSALRLGFWSIFNANFFFLFLYFSLERRFPGGLFCFLGLGTWGFGFLIFGILVSWAKATFVYDSIYRPFFFRDFFRFFGGDFLNSRVWKVSLFPLKDVYMLNRYYKYIYIIWARLHRHPFALEWRPPFLLDKTPSWKEVFV